MFSVWHNAIDLGIYFEFMFLNPHILKASSIFVWFKPSSSTVRESFSAFEALTQFFVFEKLWPMQDKPASEIILNDATYRWIHFNWCMNCAF